VLTLLGGKPVHASDEFADLAPPLPPAMPDWAPVRAFGGYAAPPSSARTAIRGAHAPSAAGAAAERWRAPECSCWAF
jgi:hypothetical protein